MGVGTVEGLKPVIAIGLGHIYLKMHMALEQSVIRVMQIHHDN